MQDHYEELIQDLICECEFARRKTENPTLPVQSSLPERLPLPVQQGQFTNLYPLLDSVNLVLVSWPHQRLPGQRGHQQ